MMKAFACVLVCALVGSVFANSVDATAGRKLSQAQEFLINSPPPPIASPPPVSPSPPPPPSPSPPPSPPPSPSPPPPSPPPPSPPSPPLPPPSPPVPSPPPSPPALTNGCPGVVMGLGITGYSTYGFGPSVQTQLCTALVNAINYPNWLISCTVESVVGYDPPSFVPAVAVSIYIKFNIANNDAVYLGYSQAVYARNLFISYISPATTNLKNLLSYVFPGSQFGYINSCNDMYDKAPTPMPSCNATVNVFKDSNYVDQGIYYLYPDAFACTVTPYPNPPPPHPPSPPPVPVPSPSPPPTPSPAVTCNFNGTYQILVYGCPGLLFSVSSACTNRGTHIQLSNATQTPGMTSYWMINNVNVQVGNDSFPTAVVSGEKNNLGCQAQNLAATGTKVAIGGNAWEVSIRPVEPTCTTVAIGGFKPNGAPISSPNRYVAVKSDCSGFDVFQPAGQTDLQYKLFNLRKIA